MKLLVSVIDKQEALESIRGGADIIDVKNPKEGSLGANFPHIIRQVKSVISKNLELSATIGDLPYLPGTASLAALGAAVSGVDYIKVGLFGVKTRNEATTLMTEVVKAVKDYNSNLKIVASGYADFKTTGCVNPLELPIVAHKAEADGVLIDIRLKNGKCKLFNFLTDKQIQDFIIQAHELNLFVGLAGSLDPHDVPRIYNLDADVLGVRGAVCTKKDRLNGKVEEEKVKTFIQEIGKL